MSTTAPPKLSYIPDIVEEHFDELQFLWGQRRNALRSATARERDLLGLEERIEGHTSGLLVIGDRLLEFVDPALAGEEELPAFAATFSLLRLATPAALSRIIQAFGTATGKTLDGMRDAMAHGPATPLLSHLTSFVQTASAPVAAAAAHVLAFHGAIAPTTRELERLLRAEEAGARAGAWRVAGYCAVSLPTAWYDAGLADEDVTVKRAALRTAAWNASPTVLPHCRGFAAKPSPDAVEPVMLLASVAGGEEYQLLESFAANEAAGAERFRVIGSFGHPYFIDFLVKEMQNADPAAAAAAGSAFLKMTARDVESDRRAKVSPDGKPPADDFEAEFQDEVLLPDPELARKHWQELAPTLARSPRIGRGMDVSQPLSREQFAALDMESRWEYCLRMRLFSGWQGTPLVLERYPQRF